ncbi:hypothetical protein H9X96_18960 [Pedobacter sp. N36a]|uniref:hypothetical protein n=1 Tax=Pedobacter sp. N36a TaxID=2767996 RepID=UPI001656AF2B|nr:hypothetical protein [Pedobacter sp. N36a]MBC8987847.1 hypothetical protein [Pedobacter sp. N36a]
MGKAIEDSTILMVPIALMDDLMKKFPTWYYVVMETYRSRFEELLEVIDSIVFKGLEERLGFYLENNSSNSKVISFI